MTTAYSLTDTLPKDASATKIVAWINAQTSQLDFALPMGIGVSAITNSSKNAGYLAVGTFTQASPVGAEHPGTQIGGVYLATSSASQVGSGQFKLAGANNRGEVYANMAGVTASQVSTSANLVKNASALVYGVHVAASTISEGNVVYVRNGSNDMVTIILSGSGNYSANIPSGGLIFDTSIAHAQTISNGAASVTVMFD